MMLGEIEFLDESFKVIEVALILMQLECFSVDSPHIFAEKHCAYVLLEDLQLVILVSMVIRNNGYTIIELINIGVCGIVN